MPEQSNKLYGWNVSIMLQAALCTSNLWDCKSDRIWLAKKSKLHTCWCTAIQCHYSQPIVVSNILYLDLFEPTCFECSLHIGWYASVQIQSIANNGLAASNIVAVTTFPGPSHTHNTQHTLGATTLPSTKVLVVMVKVSSMTLSLQ